MAESKEQKLIDIIFETGFLIANSHTLQNKTQEELAKWIANQLKGCGFNTIPCGSSWGILKK